MSTIYPYYIAVSDPAVIPEPRDAGMKYEYTNNAAEHKTLFSAYTSGCTAIFRIEAEYDKFGYSGDNTDLWFDPACSERKFHNCKAIRLYADGCSEIVEYTNKMIARTPKEGEIRVDFRRLESEYGADIYVPLTFFACEARPDGAEAPFIRFNIIRQSGQGSSRWSGLPMDTSYYGEELGGQGSGMLFFEKNMPAGTNPDRYADETARLNDKHYTVMKKTFLPGYVHSYMAEKAHGFMLSIKPEDAETARRNAAETSWGREIAAKIIAKANYWIGKTDAEIFDMLPAANPRAATPGQYYGDPVTGGNRNSLQMCIERPYEYYNPLTGVWYKNGCVIKNPSTGEEIVLDDDGSGFIAPEGFPNPGVQYMFTAAYRFYNLSVLTGIPYAPTITDKKACPETSGVDNFYAISNLAYAYLLTGENKYALRALLILGRIADLYPYMNGGRGDGTITDMAKMLEPTTTEVFMLINYFNALDIVYDAADALSDQLTAAFEKAPAPDGTNRKDNPFNIKRAVHEMIPYAIDLCDINKGVTHDSSVRWIHLKMLVAAFMGSDSLMDSTLYGGDMSFMSKIRNCYYRDGRYAYDSMEYQKLISLEMMLYPNCSYMYKYSDGRVLNLFDDSKMNCGSIISLHFKLLCGDLTPAFGDTQINNNEPIKQSRLESKAPYSPLWEAVYTRTHNENLKRMIAVALSGYTPEELESERVKSVESLDNLDSASINETMLLLACAPDSGIYKLKSEDAGVPESVLLEDSQTSILRSGTSLENTKHLIMYGQPSAPHDHGDKLGLWLGAYGYHLLAGGGGYPYTWADSKWHEWEQSSGACMVVIIDGKSQCRSYSSLKAHIDGSRVKLSSMENSGAYPGCFYGRTAALITAPDGENAFAADFAYADGGSFYDYNTSGIGLDFKNIRFSGIKKREKLSGTLAGKDVTLYSAPDYAWMKADAEANIDEEHRAEWNFRHASEVGLAVSEISVPNDASEEKLIRAYGEMGGFERGKSPWVPYVMHRKTTKAKNEKCVFAHILEPYKGSRFISRVKPLQLINASFNKNTPCFAPVGCEVEYKSGEYKDIVISCHDSSCKASFSDISGTEYTTDALFALFRYKSGRLVYAEAYGYTIARAGDFITPEHENPYYNGTITEVDYTSGHIEIEIAGEMPEASLLSGRVAVISSDDYEKPSSYYMNEIKSGGNRISFVSDMPFALQDTSWERGEKSRGMGGKTKIRDGESEYYADIKPGDAFRCETGGVLIG